MNRAFHASFVPELFRELQLRPKGLIDREQAAGLLSNRQTCHVQILKFQDTGTYLWLHHLPSVSEEELKERVDQRLSANTIKLVSCMPRLTEFQYVKPPPPGEMLHDREPLRS